MKKILLVFMTALMTLVSGCGSDSASNGLKVMLGANVVSLDTAQAVDLSSFEVIADCGF